MFFHAGFIAYFIAAWYLNSQGALMEQDFSRLDEIISAHREKKGALIPLLQAVQGLDGYLSRPVLQYIASELGIPPAEVYGVATFYSIFRLQPQGKHIIRLCKGTACHVSDADGIKASLFENLGLALNESTTKDMQFTVVEVACLGCCSLAPVIMIDDQTFGKLSPEMIPGILDRFRDAGA